MNDIVTVEANQAARAQRHLNQEIIPTGATERLRTWCLDRQLFLDSELVTREYATLAGIRTMSVHTQRNKGFGPMYRRASAQVCLYRVRDILDWMDTVRTHKARAKVLRSFLAEMQGEQSFGAGLAS